jgi:hypothetical protein
MEVMGVQMGVSKKLVLKQLERIFQGTIKRVPDPSDLIQSRLIIQLGSPIWLILSSDF